MCFCLSGKWRRCVAYSAFRPSFIASAWNVMSTVVIVGERGKTDLTFRIYIPLAVKPQAILCQGAACPTSPKSGEMSVLHLKWIGLEDLPTAKSRSWRQTLPSSRVGHILSSGLATRTSISRQLLLKSWCNRRQALSLLPGQLFSLALHLRREHPSPVVARSPVGSSSWEVFWSSLPIGCWAQPKVQIPSLARKLMDSRFSILMTC